MADSKKSQQEAYKKAEQISKEIVNMCIEKELSMQEFRFLRTALPIAINEKLDEIEEKTKLF